MELNSLLIEKYRPRKLEDVILSDELTKYFNTCIRIDKEIPHLLLHGKAGIGKTTIGKVIANELKCDFLYINGSIDNRIEIMRDKIRRFAETYSDSDVWDSDAKIKKIIFIDECERCTFQESLKVVLEELSGNCRFILATNNISKIIDPLKNDERCHMFNLEPRDQEQRSKLAQRYVTRLEHIVKEENIPYDSIDALKKIVVHTFPSMRRAITTAHKTYKIHGSLSVNIVLDNTLDQKFVDIINAVPRNYPEILKFCANSDPDTIFNDFIQNFFRYVTDPKDRDTAAEIWTEFATKRLPFNDNKEAVLIGFMIAIGSKVKLTMPAVK